MRTYAGRIGLIATGIAVGVALGVASLLEASTDPVGPGLDTQTIISAVAIAVACGIAVFSPVASLIIGLLPMVLAVLVFPQTPGQGGSHLIALILLVGYASYRLTPRAALVAYLTVSVVSGGCTAVLSGSAWEAVFFPLILGAGYGFGVLLRRERFRSAELARLAEELRAEREARTQDAILAERARISRELHDAVAHTVSVMTLQAGVVRRRMPDGSPEQEMLRSVEVLGRRSVDELRQVVGLLRTEQTGSTFDPPDEVGRQPLLSNLDDLAADVRAAGMPVQLEVQGEAIDLPDAVDRTAYRIVQEALSNASRHTTAGTTATVRITYRPDSVVVDIQDDGRPVDPNDRGPGGGYGLIGMRERVSLVGGSLEVGPRPGGGFGVHAALPLVPRGAATALAREGTRR